jgi:hypothetical protein
MPKKMLMALSHLLLAAVLLKFLVEFVPMSQKTMPENQPNC